MRSRSLPFWISLLLHGAIFGLAAVLFVKPPEFAMDAGHNSVEVNLVAGNPDPATPPPPTPEPQEPAETQPPKPDDLTVPVARETPPLPMPPAQPPPPDQPPPPPPVVPPPPQLPPSPAKGDGSAPKPGKDATTASSDGGAIMEAKPDYLSNSPPDYPDAARRDKEEGLVVLDVIVGTDGRPESIAIRNGSGFSDLDQSALAAVRAWRFRPASLGSVKVKSRVTIPIRFRLDQ